MGPKIQNMASTHCKIENKDMPSLLNSENDIIVYLFLEI